jgi:hypothetical protein
MKYLELRNTTRERVLKPSLKGNHKMSHLAALYIGCLSIPMKIDVAKRNADGTFAEARDIVIVPFGFVEIVLDLGEGEFVQQIREATELEVQTFCIAQMGSMPDMQQKQVDLSGDKTG